MKCFQTNCEKRARFSQVPIIASLIGLVVLASLGRTEPRWIQGTYRNPALGYSVRIPKGLKGFTGDAAGPERGVSIALPSGGNIVVYGEPNSFEWKRPEDGVRTEMPHSSCTTEDQPVNPVRVGKLNGAETSQICGDRVSRAVLAFRNGGSPVYWLCLDTTRTHQAEDEAIFNRVVASFNLIRWE